MLGTPRCRNAGVETGDILRDDLAKLAERRIQLLLQQVMHRNLLDGWREIGTGNFVD